MRRGAGQQADDRTGADQGEPDQQGRDDDRRIARHPEQERQHRDDRARGEEAEAGQAGRQSVADRLVLVHPLHPSLRQGGAGQHLRSAGVRLVAGHPAGPVDQRELVLVDVEGRYGRAGLLARPGCLQQLALRADRDVLAGAHRQRAGQQAGQPGEQDRVVGHAAGRDAEHEGQVGDQPVVRAEDCGPERPGQPVAATLGECPDHLGMDHLVGGHRVGGVRVGRVGRAALGALGQREHEDRPEVLREEDQDRVTDIDPSRPTDPITQEVQPVLLVPALRVGQPEQDLAFLAGPARGQRAIGGGLGPFLGQVAAPAAEVALGGGGHSGGRHAGESRKPGARPRSGEADPPARGR